MSVAVQEVLDLARRIGDMEARVAELSADTERMFADRNLWRTRCLLAERALDAVTAAIPGMAAGVPDHLLPGLQRYFEGRIATGSFLRAVLENDLRSAIARGDPTSFAALPTLVAWIERNAPPGSWGSADAVA